MAGSFVLLLHTHLPYVIRHGKWPHGAEWLFEAAAECYIPLLNECFDLRGEGIDPRITFSFSPVLLEQLGDEEFPALFEEYLQERITAAERDVRYFRERPEEHALIPVARYWMEWYRERLADFTERYDRDLIGALRDLRDAGAIAVQTCGATHGYFPLLGYDESLHAQVQIAVDAHWRHFRYRPRGIWMPECAYRPGGWKRAPVPSDDFPEGFHLGVEQAIAAGGMDYTVVDAHTVRAGEPVNWYLSRFLGHDVSDPESDPARRVPLSDPRSVYETYKIHSEVDPAYGSVSVFVRDVETALRVWSGTGGYPGHADYLEFHKKHHNSGHRYWRVTGRKTELGEKGWYDPSRIDELVREQAAEFVRLMETQLEAYRTLTGRRGVICLPFDTELFGHWWFEGPRFLGQVLRGISRSHILQSRTAPEERETRGAGLSVTIPESSWGEQGDHRVWLNEETAWTWPMIYEGERVFLELLRSRNPADPMEERILKQMGRELLLLQASDWQFLMTTGTAHDYAVERFRDHHQGLMYLAGYLRERRSGPDSMEKFDELCRLESRDRLFPDLDLELWAWRNADAALAAPAEGS